MQETIYALLALSIATTILLNVIGASVQGQLRQIDREYEVYASAVASQVLDYTSNLSFDERTTPENWMTHGPPDSTEFSASTTFGSAITCPLDKPFLSTVICDDLDDIHMDSTTWVPFEYLADTTSIPFEVNVKVVYLDRANPSTEVPSSTKTNSKEIRVKARSLVHKKMERISGGAIEISRMVSYNEQQAKSQADTSVPVCMGGATLHVNQLLYPQYLNQGATSGACSP